MRKDGTFRLDFARASTYASGFTLIIGIMGLISNFFGAIRPIVWFAIMFIISLIAMRELKKKSL